jgi:hypothetical protein
MKLTIDRNIWLRGADAEDGQESFLLRSRDGKRCCVGIYLCALGFTDHELSDKGSDDDLRVEDEHGEDDGVDPRVPAWLRQEMRVYGINDDANLTEDDREQQVADRFAVGGVEVEFVG